MCKFCTLEAKVVSRICEFAICKSCILLFHRQNFIQDVNNASCKATLAKSATVQKREQKRILRSQKKAKQQFSFVDPIYHYNERRKI